jgi:predicted aspartyl protease
MAGRFFRALDCYPHDDQSGQSRVKIVLYNAAKEEWPHTDVLAPVDTGFSGAVMVPSEEYEFFLVGELPQRFWKTYRTMTGTIKMRVARGFIAAGETESVEQTFVESPALGAGKLLVGRMMLNKRALLLDGPGRVSCFVEAQKTSS